MSPAGMSTPTPGAAPGVVSWILSGILARYQRSTQPTPTPALKLAKIQGSQSEKEGLNDSNKFVNRLDSFKASVKSNDCNVNLVCNSAADRSALLKFSLDDCKSLSKSLTCSLSLVKASSADPSDEAGTKGKAEHNSKKNPTNRFTHVPPLLASF